MNWQYKAAMIAALVMAGCAAAQEPQSAERESLITRRAVVQTVDVEARQVLLLGESGRLLTVDAGPDIRNLEQLESGDVVTLQYYEAVAVSMADAAMAGAPTGAVVTERAPEGAKPGGAVARSVNLVVQFVSYDPAASVATFVMPDGTVESVVVKPEMQEFAAARQSGDLIDLTITRALAISIEEATG